MRRAAVAWGFLILAVPAAAADGFKAGVASRVITPKQPMWLAGYAARTKPSDGKLHDIYAKALALEDANGSRLVLVTTDLIGLPRSLSEEVAAAVNAKFGVDRARLMLTSSHTHSGPVVAGNLSDMYPFTPGEAEKVTAYAKTLKDDLVAVVGEALTNLAPAKLAIGHGKAGFAVNRRQQTDKGVALGVNAAGPVDHTVPVLVVSGADGKPKAVAFGYACHNTTLDGDPVSGDYAGFAQADVEKAMPGVTALFWTGCGADANPNPRRTVELAAKHGKELADAVVKTAGGKLEPLAGAFDAKYETIALKHDQMPDRARLAADALSSNQALRKRSERLLKQLTDTGKLDDTYPHYPIQVWTVGDTLRWVALGGEVVIDYAIRLKKELPTDRTLWVAGYANDVMGYVASARVIGEGGYEVDSSMVYYGLPSRWHPSVEDAIVNKVKALAGGPGAKTPKDEQATFRIADGFRAELAACEPDVVDPVAMCFDERGRLFVCEMRGYPNGGVGTGDETRGRVRCLEDKDGDGVFETARTFADGLRFPMGVTPYKGGVIVAVAPDILYLEDTDGDGVADKRTVLYTGFNLANIQQMVNSLQWGLDNWVYACAGNDGGIVTCPQKPGFSVNLRNRGLRFHPDRPGDLEPTSSGGQYGLTADDYQRWFTATNSQHLRQIVLPDHYLARNPHLAVPAVTLDIPDHGAAAKVFRISAFEPWRVERTTRRAGGADAKRFPTTELVPGGYVTSGCSPLVYTADLLAGQYGRNFVCDPANNLIHREQLVENGAAFRATRTDADREFLASTDNWFRPVSLTLGPDGAIYVLDFYREVIETPLSLPDDIKARLNLESRGRGRIWRIAPTGFTPAKMPDLSWMATNELVSALSKPNSWWRQTAQRLLVERRAKDAAVAIRAALPASAGKPARANLLWTLSGLGVLTAADVQPVFDDPEPGNREQALRLAEGIPELRAHMAKLAADPSPRVRFQLALSAGVLPAADAAAVVATVLLKDAGDPWTVTAGLSSAAGCAIPLAESLALAKSPLLARLAAVIGAKGDDADLTRLLGMVADGSAGPAVLDGLASGMRNTKRPLSAWLADPPADARAVVAKLRTRFESAAGIVRSAAPAADRVAAAGLLASGPFDLAGPALAAAVTPTTPADVQTAAVRALASHADPQVSDLLLGKWATAGPGTRRELLDALSARPDRLLKLLAAVEANTVAAGELDPARVQQWKAHPSAAVRTKAAAVLRSAVNADRAKVIAGYADALKLTGDAARGKAVFRTHCAACHKLDGVGHDVGANLLAALPNKSPADLLVAVFDPNREVDPRYVGYQATTADGRVLTGVVAAEGPTSVTLRRADGAEDVILRADLESLRSTRQSLMPEGFEKQIPAKDAADLFAYLRTAGK